MFSLPCRNQFLVLAIKTYAKAAIKVFRSCPILLDLLTCYQLLCRGLWLHQSTRDFKSRQRYAYYYLNQMLYQGRLILEGSISLNVFLQSFMTYIHYSSISIKTDLSTHFTVCKIITLY